MKSQCVVAGAVASAILSLSVVTASAATTTLTDGDFASIAKNTISQSGSVAIGAGQCLTCGNPGGLGLQALVGAISATPASASIAFTDNALTYDPSVSGAITSINAQYDRQVLSTAAGDTFPITFRLVAAQGSGTFATSINLGGTQNAGVYNTLLASNLTAANFALISGSGILDFASSGQITFGVEAILAPAGNVTQRANFDNFNITINPNPVPLPGALPLFATGLGALGLLGWRRKRKATAGATRN